MSSNMSEGPNQDKSYQEKATEFAKQQYENWAPWMEDQYLKFFTKDNKASWTTKGISITCFLSRFPFTLCS